MLRAWGYKLVVQDPPAEPQRESGIILPPGYELVGRGIVVSVGPLVNCHLSDPGDGIDPGDVVYYRAGAAEEIGEFRIITSDCVFAVED